MHTYEEGTSHRAAVALLPPPTAGDLTDGLSPWLGKARAKAKTKPRAGRKPI